MLLDQLRQDLHVAQKQRLAVTIATLRFLLANLINARIAKGGELTDAEVLGQIQREVKHRKESIEAFTRGNRTDLAKKEQAELLVLQSYVPKQLSEAEVLAVVTQAMQKTGACSTADIGKVIGAVMAAVKGQADGAMVSQLVKERLS